jgi:hypothetical protein
MSKLFTIVLLSMAFFLNAQTIWSGHFNITKIDTLQYNVQLVLQSDPGLQNTLIAEVCETNWINSFNQQTISLTLDSNNLYQQQPYLPTMEVSYYSGILDVTGVPYGDYIELRFIHCCRPPNINSFYNDNWAWYESPMFVTVSGIAILPDSIHPIGFSIGLDPYMVWVPVDSLSSLTIPIWGIPYQDFLVHQPWFFYQGRANGNNNPCCLFHQVNETDTCGGLQSAWTYNSMQSMLSFSNSGGWITSQSGEIQWNPNQLGNISKLFRITRDGMSTDLSHTYRVFDSSLDISEVDQQLKPVFWEVWDITGRLIYSGDDWLNYSSTMMSNKFSKIGSEIYICKIIWDNGNIEWTKIF